MSRSARTMEKELFEAARDAMAKAHAPYSKFPVGAAIRAEDGKIYTGANIENLSFPEGWCAETTAISHMVMAGQRKIMEVAVIAEKLALCPPCGGCRQRLAEFSGASTRIFLCDETGVKKTLALSDLLPHSFETEILG
ncbi:cytidine deaminase [Ensifer adhaerens]|nr:cytidine deaminase [Ensifer adhaerens]KQX04619.1 cytidine deaminase [Ensifer sp. Root423]KQX53990.1 cytidine deaminase [Ensifer sp. Root1298]KQX85677.1 cytidine deaminase [Ensifer sp. Root1312]KQZ51150.1 cytidine deaminase [Ensifer sp. Root558]KRC22734.1 cytidine deaminase [Ensifer sp. Root74]KRD57498.1 cytidine deaminase [Ensifer sp. Root954]KRD72844.1 cytidine deaminase [Ensifer sp. Root278]OCO98808.1 cytidine deaminase [Ensifer sp. LC14]OCP13287.1 cytidine deaminase [Ensifer sp. LC13